MPLARAGSVLPAALLAGLLFCGRFYAEMPTVVALLLGTSPFAAMLVPAGWTERRGPLVASFVHAAAVAIPVTAALIVAWHLAPPLDLYY